MAYRISFKKSVSRNLKKLDKSEAKKLLDMIVPELRLNADAIPVLKDKFKGLRKYRIEDYRVIFAILEKSIVITRIRLRKDANK